MFPQNLDPKLGDLLTIIGWVLTILGLYLTLLQIQKNNAVNRSRFMLDFMHQHFSDKGIVDFFDKMDWHGEDGHEIMSNKDDELSADKILYSLDLLGMMLKNNVLTRDEINIIAWRINRFWKSGKVSRYIDFLDSEYKNLGAEQCHTMAKYLVSQLPKTPERTSLIRN